MSIRPTDIKEPIFEAEPDITETEIKKKELKKYYIILIILLVIDLIITITVILQESNIFNDEENNLTFLLVNIILFTVFILFVLISLSFFRVGLTMVIKYLYGIFLIIYLFYFVIRKIIFFVNYFDDVNIVHVLFFFLVLLTIIPRVFFYNLIDIFINKIKEKYECQMGEEHEDFRQDLANKMERGDNTNWSKTSLPNDPKRYST